ncbi:LytTR family DNA-binding domain-containing protein [Opitutus sp. ER46]|uniref:LytR/AlgR family response regulator transcription factor n=1 Tax=Opitutus sp. ER46 TaxID=2161864 RepID=UPI000D2F6E25|nr:LytTR family DNA-binding domain-containing protein [Opitutus sp. ER46]PTX96442.1 hypothetical protein DB354_07200 [Opitutus sp. ER46]
MNLRALIIDDDAAARTHLRTLLSDDPGVDVVAETDASFAPGSLLAELSPQLVFLGPRRSPTGDFSLSPFDGLTPAPAIVVVSPHAELAARAFEHDVAGFLLKPCRPERLRQMLARVRRHLACRAVPAATAPRAAPLHRFVVRNEQQLDIVPAAHVDWLGAAGNYVVLHAGHDTHVLRESLCAVEARLDAAQFVRISRSTVVNIDRIRSVTTPASGAVSVVLRDGTQLPLTRGTRELQALLERG